MRGDKGFEQLMIMMNTQYKSFHPSLCVSAFADSFLTLMTASNTEKMYWSLCSYADPQAILSCECRVAGMDELIQHARLGREPRTTTTTTPYIDTDYKAFDNAYVLH